MRQLSVERIDLLQLHRVDPAVPLEDQLGALAQGIAFIPWLPIAGGNHATSKLLAELAPETGATPSQLSLAWLLHITGNAPDPRYQLRDAPDRERKGGRPPADERPTEPSRQRRLALSPG
ncbi:hypothetical protein [Kribbella sp. DT2]|uniref:hypothetical protein n=1 Tax=Kribbella sp. DT2 TaxID=3393427 RepID=UPI003CF80E32